MKDIIITEGVAKYLLAILLDSRQVKQSGQMHDHAQKALATALFGQNADFVDASDASSLVFEGMRSTVWA